MSNRHNKAHDLCKKDLKSFLNKHQQHAQWFMTPVDYVALHIPQYPDVIKFPMDFGTILKRLNKYEFVHFDQFASDVTLIFANAILFNPPDHAIHQCALTLKHTFGDSYYRLLNNPAIAQWTYSNVPPTRGSQQPMPGAQNSQCHELLQKILEMDESFGFGEPVEWFQQDLAQYPREVGRLMDLGTVRNWLKCKEYASPDIFARDVRQVFKNAMKFNQEGSTFHSQARTCYTVFERLFASCQFHSKAAANPPRPAHPAANPASQDNVAPSTADVEALASQVKKLGSNKLYRLICEVKTRFPAVVSQPAPDEYELDFDNLNNATFIGVKTLIDAL